MTHFIRVRIAHLIVGESGPGPCKSLICKGRDGAAGGNRTHDLSLTKDALYH